MFTRIRNLARRVATAFRPKPWEPRSTDVERAIVVKVLEDQAGVRNPDARDVDAIALAARRLAIAIQRHDDELVEAREASAVEDRLRTKLYAEIGEARGVRLSNIPIVGQEIVVRFSGLEAYR
jgi:hypothetical protein